MIEEARSDAGGSTNRLLQGIASEATDLDKQVNDASGSYPQPMLLSQLNYLAGMTSRADQIPGADAYTRLNELQQEVETVRARTQTLKRRLSATTQAE